MENSETSNLRIACMLSILILLIVGTCSVHLFLVLKNNKNLTESYAQLELKAFNCELDLIEEQRSNAKLRQALRELEEANKAMRGQITDLEERNKSPVIALLNILSTNALVTYELPEGNYPPLGWLNKISCQIVRDAKDSRPIHAEIKMLADSPKTALEIQNKCLDEINRVYHDASKIGNIPPELINAFIVSRRDMEATIHFFLPDEMAKYLFSQFYSTHQEKKDSLNRHE